MECGKGSKKPSLSNAIPPLPAPPPPPPHLLYGSVTRNYSSQSVQDAGTQSSQHQFSSIGNCQGMPSNRTNSVIMTQQMNAGCKVGISSSQCGNHGPATGNQMSGGGYPYCGGGNTNTVTYQTIVYQQRIENSGHPAGFCSTISNHPSAWKPRNFWSKDLNSSAAQHMSEHASTYYRTLQQMSMQRMIPPVQHPTNPKSCRFQVAFQQGLSPLNAQTPCNHQLVNSQSAGHNVCNCYNQGKNFSVDREAMNKQAFTSNHEHINEDMIHRTVSIPLNVCHEKGCFNNLKTSAQTKAVTSHAKTSQELNVPVGHQQKLAVTQNEASKQVELSSRKFCGSEKSSEQNNQTQNLQNHVQSKAHIVKSDPRLKRTQATNQTQITSPSSQESLIINTFIRKATQQQECDDFVKQKLKSGEGIKLQSYLLCQNTGEVQNKELSRREIQNVTQGSQQSLINKTGTENSCGTKKQNGKHKKADSKQMTQDAATGRNDERTKPREVTASTETQSAAFTSVKGNQASWVVENLKPTAGTSVAQIMGPLKGTLVCGGSKGISEKKSNPIQKSSMAGSVQIGVGGTLNAKVTTTLAESLRTINVAENTNEASSTKTSMAMGNSVSAKGASLFESMKIDKKKYADLIRQILVTKSEKSVAGEKGNSLTPSSVTSCNTGMEKSTPTSLLFNKCANIKKEKSCNLTKARVIGLPETNAKENSNLTRGTLATENIMMNIQENSNVTKGTSVNESARAKKHQRFTKGNFSIGPAKTIVIRKGFSKSGDSLLNERNIDLTNRTLVTVDSPRTAAVEKLCAAKGTLPTENSRTTIVENSGLKKRQRTTAVENLGAKTGILLTEGPRTAVVEKFGSEKGNSLNETTRTTVVGNSGLKKGTLLTESPRISVVEKLDIKKGTLLTEGPRATVEEKLDAEKGSSLTESTKTSVVEKSGAKKGTSFTETKTIVVKLKNTDLGDNILAISDNPRTTVVKKSCVKKETSLAESPKANVVPESPRTTFVEKPCARKGRSLAKYPRTTVVNKLGDNKETVLTESPNTTLVKNVSVEKAASLTDSLKITVVEKLGVKNATFTESPSSSVVKKSNVKKETSLTEGSSRLFAKKETDLTENLRANVMEKSSAKKGTSLTKSPRTTFSEKFSDKKGNSLSKEGMPLKESPRASVVEKSNVKKGTLTESPEASVMEKLIAKKEIHMTENPKTTVLEKSGDKKGTALSKERKPFKESPRITVVEKLGTKKETLTKKGIPLTKSPRSKTTAGEKSIFTLETLVTREPGTTDGEITISRKDKTTKSLGTSFMQKSNSTKQTTAFVETKTCTPKKSHLVNGTNVIRGTKMEENQNITTIGNVVVNSRVVENSNTVEENTNETAVADLEEERQNNRNSESDVSLKCNTLQTSLQECSSLGTKAEKLIVTNNLLKLDVKRQKKKNCEELDDKVKHLPPEDCSDGDGIGEDCSDGDGIGANISKAVECESLVNTESSNETIALQDSTEKHISVKDNSISDTCDSSTPSMLVSLKTTSLQNVVAKQNNVEKDHEDKKENELIFKDETTKISEEHFTVKESISSEKVCVSVSAKSIEEVKPSSCVSKNIRHNLAAAKLTKCDADDSTSKDKMASDVDIQIQSVPSNTSQRDLDSGNVMSTDVVDTNIIQIKPTENEQDGNLEEGILSRKSLCESLSKTPNTDQQNVIGELSKGGKMKDVLPSSLVTVTKKQFKCDQSIFEKFQQSIPLCLQETARAGELNPLPKSVTDPLGLSVPLQPLALQLPKNNDLINNELPEEKDGELELRSANKNLGAANCGERDSDIKLGKITSFDAVRSSPNITKVEKKRNHRKRRCKSVEPKSLSLMSLSMSDAVASLRTDSVLETEHTSLGASDTVASLQTDSIPKTEHKQDSKMNEDKFMSNKETCNISSQELLVFSEKANDIKQKIDIKESLTLEAESVEALDRNFDIDEKPYHPIALPLGCHVCSDSDSDEGTASKNCEEAMRLEKLMAKMGQDKYELYLGQSTTYRPWVLYPIDMDQTSLRKECDDMEVFDRNKEHCTRASTSVNNSNVLGNVSQEKKDSFVNGNFSDPRIQMVRTGKKTEFRDKTVKLVKEKKNGELEQNGGQVNGISGAGEKKTENSEVEIMDHVGNGLSENYQLVESETPKTRSTTSEADCYIESISDQMPVLTKVVNNGSCTNVEQDKNNSRIIEERLCYGKRIIDGKMTRAEAIVDNRKIMDELIQETNNPLARIANLLSKKLHSTKVKEMINPGSRIQKGIVKMTSASSKMSNQNVSHSDESSSASSKNSQYNVSICHKSSPGIVKMTSASSKKLQQNISISDESPVIVKMTSASSKKSQNVSISDESPVIVKMTSASSKKPHQNVSISDESSPVVVKMTSASSKKLQQNLSISDNSSPGIVKGTTASSKKPQQNVSISDESPVIVKVTSASSKKPHQNVSISNESSPVVVKMTSASSKKLQQNLSISDDSSPGIVKGTTASSKTPQQNVSISDESSPVIVKMTSASSQKTQQNVSISDESSPVIVKMTSSSSKKLQQNVPIVDESSPEMTSASNKNLQQNVSISDNYSPGIVKTTSASSKNSQHNLSISDESSQKIVKTMSASSKNSQHKESAVDKSSSGIVKVTFASSKKTQHSVSTSDKSSPEIVETTSTSSINSQNNVSIVDESPSRIVKMTSASSKNSQQNVSTSDTSSPEIVKTTSTSSKNSQHNVSIGDEYSLGIVKMTSASIRNSQHNVSICDESSSGIVQVTSASFKNSQDNVSTNEFSSGTIQKTSASSKNSPDNAFISDKSSSGTIKVTSASGTNSLRIVSINDESSKKNHLLTTADTMPVITKPVEMSCSDRPCGIKSDLDTELKDAAEPDMPKLQRISFMVSELKTGTDLDRVTPQSAKVLETKSTKDAVLTKKQAVKRNVIKIHDKLLMRESAQFLGGDFDPNGSRTRRKARRKHLSSYVSEPYQCKRKGKVTAKNVTEENQDDVSQVKNVTENCVMTPARTSAGIKRKLDEGKYDSEDSNTDTILNKVFQESGVCTRNIEKKIRKEIFGVASDIEGSTKGDSKDQASKKSYHKKRGRPASTSKQTASQTERKILASNDPICGNSLQRKIKGHKCRTLDDGSKKLTGKRKPEKNIEPGNNKKVKRSQEENMLNHNVKSSFDTNVIKSDWKFGKTVPKLRASNSVSPKKKALLKNLKPLEVATSKQSQKCKKKPTVDKKNFPLGNVRVRLVTDREAQKGVKAKRPVSCRYCKKMVPSKMITVHVKKSHPFRCYACHKLFSSKNEKQQHNSSVHNAEQALYHCGSCSRVFNSAVRMEIHCKSGTHQQQRSNLLKKINMITEPLKKITDLFTSRQYLAQALPSLQPSTQAILPVEESRNTNFNESLVQEPFVSFLTTEQDQKNVTKNIHHEEPELRHVVKELETLYKCLSCLPPTDCMMPLEGNKGLVNMNQPTLSQYYSNMITYTRAGSSLNWQGGMCSDNMPEILCQPENVMHHGMHVNSQSGTPIQNSDIMSLHNSSNVNKLSHWPGQSNNLPNSSHSNFIDNRNAMVVDLEQQTDSWFSNAIEAIQNDPPLILGNPVLPTSSNKGQCNSGTNCISVPSRIALTNHLSADNLFSDLGRTDLHSFESVSSAASSTSEVQSSNTSGVPVYTNLENISETDLSIMQGKTSSQIQNGSEQCPCKHKGDFLSSGRVLNHNSNLTEEHEFGTALLNHSDRNGTFADDSQGTCRNSPVGDETTAKSLLPENINDVLSAAEGLLALPGNFSDVNKMGFSDSFMSPCQKKNLNGTKISASSTAAILPVPVINNDADSPESRNSDVVSSNDGSSFSESCDTSQNDKNMLVEEYERILSDIRLDQIECGDFQE